MPVVLLYYPQDPNLGGNGAYKMQDKVLYSIGQVSRLCKVPVKTLRYYDEIKVLIPRVRKEVSNYRYYTKEQLIMAFMIRQLRLHGFRLKTIKDIVSKNNLKGTIAGIEERLREVERDIADLKDCWQVNNNLLERLKAGQNLWQQMGNCEATSIFSLGEIPQVFLLCSRTVMKSYHNEEVNLERWIEITERTVTQELKIAGAVYITFFTEMFGQFYEKHCDVEFAVQVEPPVKRNPQVRQFGGFLGATALHYGPYAEIFKTYIALKRWLDEQDYEVSGHVTEEFLISPLDTRNETEHLTKIIAPVRKMG